MRKINIFNMVLISLFTALTAISAFIQIPFYPVSFSLQTIFVLLSGVILGAKSGALSQLLYVLIGLTGVPVFTKGGGINYIFQPSFGYLIGFIIASFVLGLILKNRIKPIRVFISSVVGVIVIYIIGVSYLYIINNLYLGNNMTMFNAVKYGALLFLPKDLISCVIVALAVLPLKRGIDSINNKSN